MALVMGRKTNPEVEQDMTELCVVLYLYTATCLHSMASLIIVVVFVVVDYVFSSE